MTHMMMRCTANFRDFCHWYKIGTYNKCKYAKPGYTIFMQKCCDFFLRHEKKRFTIHAGQVCSKKYDKFITNRREINSISRQPPFFLETAS